MRALRRSALDVGTLPGMAKRGGDRGNVKPDGPDVRGRGGRPRLNAAEIHQRDTLMIARRAQGWTWERVAKEANLTVSNAKKAVVKAQRSGEVMRIGDDPVKIVERIFDELQRSVVGQELIATEAMKRGTLGTASAAKNRADEARGKVLELLQMTGRLPQEMSALRHLIDLRTVAVRMLDTMDQFDRGEIDSVVVRSTFNELLGLESAPALEGSAKELTA